MTQTPHTHPCEECGMPVTCDGTYERNHDGWPPATCSDYHLSGGVRAVVICEDCAPEEDNDDEEEG